MVVYLEEVKLCPWVIICGSPVGVHPWSVKIQTLEQGLFLQSCLFFDKCS